MEGFSRNSLLNLLRYVPRVIVTDKAQELLSGDSCSDAECRTAPAAVSEQPSREFASPNRIASEGDKAVQVSGPRATFSLSLWDHYLTLPSGYPVFL